jgi:hypothetical protein
MTNHHPNPNRGPLRTALVALLMTLLFLAVPYLILSLPL